MTHVNSMETKSEIRHWNMTSIFMVILPTGQLFTFPQGHLRHARGSIKLKNFDTATSDYIQCFQCAVLKNESRQVKVELLAEIVNFFLLFNLSELVVTLCDELLILTYVEISFMNLQAVLLKLSFGP